MTLQLDHVEDSVVLCAEIEAEIAQLDPADRPSFLADYGLESPASDRLIKTCYRCGGLICFITVGPDEVRAWEIAAGSTAVEAAGKIHTDLARGFIRAETVAYDDFVANTDMKGAQGRRQSPQGRQDLHCAGRRSAQHPPRALEVQRGRARPPGGPLGLLAGAASDEVLHPAGIW